MARAPIEATTQFVDGSYAGNDSDGSTARPWKTIPQGITAAAPGAVVAIAAGSYDDGVWSQGKAVRRWGRCPAMVGIVGNLPGYAAVELSQGDGAELHDLSITGVSFGVYAHQAEGRRDRRMIPSPRCSCRVAGKRAPCPRERAAARTTRSQTFAGLAGLALGLRGKTISTPSAKT